MAEGSWLKALPRLVTGFWLKFKGSLQVKGSFLLLLSFGEEADGLGKWLLLSVVCMALAYIERLPPAESFLSFYM